jgi:hypothetical protein
MSVHISGGSVQSQVEKETDFSGSPEKGREVPNRYWVVDFRLRTIEIISTGGPNAASMLLRKVR